MAGRRRFRFATGAAQALGWRLRQKSEWRVGNFPHEPSILSQIAVSASFATIEHAGDRLFTANQKSDRSKYQKLPGTSEMYFLDVDVN